MVMITRTMRYIDGNFVRIIVRIMIMTGAIPFGNTKQKTNDKVKKH